MRASSAALLCLLTFPGAGAAADLAEPSLTPDFDSPAPTQAPVPVPKAKPAPAPIPFEPDEDVPLPFNPTRPPKEVFERPEKPHRPWVVFRTREWFTTGSVDTRWHTEIPPNEVSPATLEVDLGETENRGMTGLMVVNSAEIAPLNWLSFEAEYGTDKPQGAYADRYWVNSPGAYILVNESNGATWSNPHYEDDLVYNATESGMRDWVSATMYLRALDSKINAPESVSLHHTLDFGVGPERYRQNVRETNLALVTNEGKLYAPGAPLGPVPGYDSTYLAAWQGVHLAIRDVVVAEGFSLEGLVLWSPLMEYEGDGYENLNAGPGGYRTQSPNFQDFAHGTAIHFAITCAYKWSYLSIEAGYQRLYFYSRTGTRRYYNADGSTTDYALDFATADLGGAFVGASLGF